MLRDFFFPRLFTVSPVGTFLTLARFLGGAEDSTSEGDSAILAARAWSLTGADSIKTQSNACLWYRAVSIQMGPQRMRKIELLPGLLHGILHGKDQQVVYEESTYIQVCKRSARWNLPQTRIVE